MGKKINLVTPNDSNKINESKGDGKQMSEASKKPLNKTKNKQPNANKGPPRNVSKIITRTRVVKVLNWVRGFSLDQLANLMIRIVFAMKERYLMAIKPKKRSHSSVLHCLVLAILTTIFVSPLVVAFTTKDSMIDTTPNYTYTDIFAVGIQNKWVLTFMSLEHNDTSEFASGRGSFGNIIFELPDDMCAEGEKIVKDCVRLDHEIWFDEYKGEYSCAIYGAKMRIFYNRCVRHPRHLHGSKHTTSHKKDNKYVRLVKTCTRFINVLFQKHPYVLGAVTVFLMFNINMTGLMAVLMIVMIGIAGSNAYDINEAQVIHGTTRSIVQFPINSKETYHLVTKHNYTMDIEFTGLMIQEMVVVKQLFQHCTKQSSTSTNGCAGGSTIIPKPYTEGHEVCETMSIQRGWFSGCALFGEGQVQTCVNIDCEHKVEIATFNLDGITVRGAIRIGSHLYDFVTPINMFSLIDLGEYGVINMRINFGENWGTNTYRVAEHGNTYIELKEHVDNWLGPYKIPGGKLKGLDRILIPVRVTADEIVWNMKTPQWLPSGQDIKYKNLIPIKASECVLNIEDLQAIPIDRPCKVTRLDKLSETEVYAGNKAIILQVNVYNNPCLLILNCTNVNCHGNAVYIKQGSTTFQKILGVMDGENVIEANGKIVSFNHEKSTVKDFTEFVTKEFSTSIENIMGGSFSAYNLAVLLMSKVTMVLVVVGAMCLLINRAYIKGIGILILIFAFTPFTKADLFCGYESGEGMFCTTGMTVRDRSVSKSSSVAFEIENEDFRDVLSNTIKELGVLNIVCASIMECNSLPKIIREVSDVKQVIVNIGKTPVFPRVSGTVMRANINGRNYYYVSTGRLFKNKGSRVKIIDSSQAERFKENTIWFPLKSKGSFGGMVTTLYIVDAEDEFDVAKGHCPQLRTNQGSNGQRYIHSDESSFFEARNEQFYQYQASQILLCKRRSTTVLGKPIPDNKMIIPKQIGGPPTIYNSIQNYTEQIGWEWKTPPYSVSIGAISGIKVIQDPKCRRSNVTYNIKKSKEWCCRKCTNETILYQQDGKGEIFLAHEIQPIRNSEEREEKEPIVEKFKPIDRTEDLDEEVLEKQYFHEGQPGAGQSVDKTKTMINDNKSTIRDRANKKIEIRKEKEESRVNDRPVMEKLFSQRSSSDTSLIVSRTNYEDRLREAISIVETYLTLVGTSYPRTNIEYNHGVDLTNIFEFIINYVDMKVDKDESRDILIKLFIEYWQTLNLKDLLQEYKASTYNKMYEMMDQFVEDGKVLNFHEYVGSRFFLKYALDSRSPEQISHNLGLIYNAGSRTFEERGNIGRSFTNSGDEERKEINTIEFGHEDGGEYEEISILPLKQDQKGTSVDMQEETTTKASIINTENGEEYKANDVSSGAKDITGHFLSQTLLVLTTTWMIITAKVGSKERMRLLCLSLVFYLGAFCLNWLTFTQGSFYFLHSIQMTNYMSMRVVLGTIFHLMMNGEILPILLSFNLLKAMTTRKGVLYIVASAVFQLMISSLGMTMIATAAHLVMLLKLTGDPVWLAIPLLTPNWREMTEIAICLTLALLIKNFMSYVKLSISNRPAMRDSGVRIIFLLTLLTISFGFTMGFDSPVTRVTMLMMGFFMMFLMAFNQFVRLNLKKIECAIPSKINLEDEDQSLPDLIGKQTEDGIKIGDVEKKTMLLETVLCLAAGLSFKYSLALAILFLSLAIFVTMFKNTITTRSDNFSVLSTGSDVNMTEFSGVLPDGLYILEANVFGLMKQVGVGYVNLGTFHTSYHVTHGSPIYYNNQILKATWMNVHRDIITYGGNWTGDGYLDGKVQLLAKEPGCLPKIEVLRTGIVNVDDEERFYVEADRLPGTSGSPFFNLQGNFCGVYGNGFIRDGVFCSTIEKPRDIDREFVHRASSQLKEIISMHPGAGKTRKIILKYVTENMLSHVNTIILTPTRVVMDEVLKVLEENGIKATKRNAKGHLVMVMCHATFVSRVAKDPSILKKKAHIIMDECHYLDPKSIAARGIMEHMHMRGNRITLLSATPPGFVGECRSNYPITNEKEPMTRQYAKKFESLMTKYFQMKIVFFLPTVRMCEEMASSFHGIALHSKNFETEYHKAKSSERPIFTTNISEMGANLNADVVVDIGIQNTPVLEDGCVVMKMKKTSIASRNQRRGRIGRRRPGYYVEFDNDADTDGTDICWHEAQMILDNLEMPALTEEIEYFPKHMGEYRLLDLQRQRFLEDIFDYDIAPTIWLSWSLRKAGMDPWKTDWIKAGGKRSMIVKETEVMPMFYDERLSIDQTFINHIQGREARRKYAPEQRSISVTSLIIARLFERQFWETLNESLIKRLDIGSRLLLNEDLPEKMKERSQDALLILGLSLLLIAFISLQVIGRVWRILTFFRKQTVVECSSVNVDVLLRSLMVVGAIGWLIFKDYPPAMIIFVGFAYLTISPLITLEGRSSSRSSYDMEIFKWLFITFAIVGVVLLIEYDAIPETTGLLKKAFERHNVQRNDSSFAQEWKFDLSNISLPVLTTFMLLTGFFEPLYERFILRASIHLYNWLFSNSTAGMTAPIGFNIASIEWITVVSAIPIFLMTANCFSLIGLIAWGIMVMIISYQAWYETAVRTSHANQETTRRDIPEHPINTLEPKRLNRVIAKGFIILILLSLIFFVSHIEKIVLVIFICLIITDIKGTWTIPFGDIYGLTLALSVLNGFIVPAVISLILNTIMKQTTTNLRSLKSFAKNEGYLWKDELNKLSKRQFECYKLHKVVNQDKGDYVSKGGIKIEDLIHQSGLKAHGDVVDLGCGRGGFSQHLAMDPKVTSIQAFTLGGDRLERPQRISTYGHNIIIFKECVDVYKMDPFKVDLILCDIGESDPNPIIEGTRTMKNLTLLEKWKEINHKADFIIKILNPYDRNVLLNLERLSNKYGGTLYRCKYSRNSTAEMYFISGKRDSIGMRVLNNIRILTKRLKEQWKPSKEIEGPKLRVGTRCVYNTAKMVDEILYQRRIDKIREENRGTWHFDNDHPYRSFKYCGSYATSRRNPGGKVVNPIVQDIMWPWNKLLKVTKHTMTDVSTAAQQQVLREKVDTCNVSHPLLAKKLSHKVMRWLWKQLFMKRNPRIMTKQDFINNVRNNAAIGGWSEDINWTDVQEAINDTRFWEMVDKERALHLKGDCELCIYNTMGKKEKKPTTFGRERGSRTIWYQWLGGRFLEYEALGFLNEDHWVSRDVLPGGVGGIGVNYLGYIIKDIGDRCEYMFADDVAGWDTKISTEDLDEEEMMTEFITDQYHRTLIKSVYLLMYKTIVAIFPRESLNSNSGTVMDVVVRGDQRGSGQVVTYALNTITNAKVQLCRVLEMEGFYNEEKIDQVEKWLNAHGNAVLENMAIAGDDVVVGTNNKKFGESLNYINDVGKIRKDIEPSLPSPCYDSWEEVSFCSHHFHELQLKDGRKLIAPCRDEHEIVGRSRIQKGSLKEYNEAANISKAYAQMWLLYFFHRRDLRLGAMAICSAIPSNWVPTGRTSWSIHQKHEWMTTEDMLEVWNRVWVYDNPWMLEKERVRSWDQVPYVHKAQDKLCGSLIGNEDRASWAKDLPNVISRVRNRFKGEKFSDYLSTIHRYRELESKFWCIN